MFSKGIFHKKRSLFLLTITLVVFLCALSLFSMASIDGIAYAAGAKPYEYANLENTYLRTGVNLLSTAAAQDDNTGGYWPSSGSSYETQSYNAQDFYTRGASVAFKPDHVEFYDGNLYAKLRVNAEASSMESALSKAMQDPNFVVSVGFEANIRLVGNYQHQASFQTSLKWYPKGEYSSIYSTISSEVINQNGGASLNHQLILGEDNAHSGVYPNYQNVLYTNTEIIHEDACFVLEIKEVSNINNLKFNVYSPKMVVDVYVKDLEIDLDSYALTVSGNNREESHITGVKNDESDGPEKLLNTFVKAGDYITLEAKVVQYGYKYEFPSFYTALFFPSSFQERTCLDWHIYNSLPDESIAPYLEVVPLDLTAPEEEKDDRYWGYNIQFRVKNGVGNTSQVKMLPRLPVKIESGTLIYSDFDIGPVSEKEIVVKVDDIAPSSPIIDPTKGLGLAIANREWYTISRTITLDYSSTLTTDFSKNSEEKVFAYVLYKDVTEFDVNLCDFSLPASAQDNKYPFGDGVSMASMQDLGKYTNLLLGGGKLPLNIATPGEYTLVLIAVDAAGNLSSPTIYHSGNRQPIKVDDTSKEVGFVLRYGQVEYQTNYPAILGDVYIYMGSTWHTKNLDGTYTFTATDSNLSGDGVFQKRTNPAKRNQPITLRFIMKPVHYNNYQVVRYSNHPAMEGMWSDSPVYRTGRDGIYYEITFMMNDEIWNSGQNSGLITMYFNRRVDLSLKSSDFIFSKNPNTGLGEVISLDGYIEAFFPYNPATEPKTYPPVQPDIDIVYYQLEEYEVFIKTKEENGQTVTTTGGYVIYKGREYVVPDTYDLLAASRVGNTTIIEDSTNEFHLTSISRTERPFKEGDIYREFLIKGYIESNFFVIGFIDAGSYVYKATVNLAGSTNLFGEKIEIYEIQKADPNVFGLHSENTLEYGNSMDALMFSSTYENGAPVNEPTFYYGDKKYYSSASGVYGYYEITSPSPGTPQYDKPTVNSNLKITVVFYPIDVISGVTNQMLGENWGSVFYNYYERVMLEDGTFDYTLIPGKSHFGNYQIQTTQIIIEIKPAKAYLAVNPATTSTTFNQYPQGLEVIVYSDEGKTEILEGIQTIVKYKDLQDENSVYSLEKPINAGRYKAKIDINTLSANYYNEASLEPEFTINKRELLIVPSSTDGDEDDIGYLYQRYASPIEVGKYEVSDYFSFNYGYLDIPMYKYGEDIEGVFVEVPGLYVIHSFFKIKDENGNFLDPYGDLVFQTDYGVLISDLLTAGTHLAEIAIVNQNYEGVIYAFFEIAQGSAEGNKLLVNFPNLKKPYDVISPNGTNQGRLGHIEYGQTIESQFNVLFAEVNTKGTYTYRNKSSQISGRFYFEEELDYYNRMAESPIYRDGKAILDVKYSDESSTARIVPHSVTLYWQAGEYVSQEDGFGGTILLFVPNNNFLILSFPVELYVVRASPNFSGLSFSNIIYKEELGAAHIEGDVFSNGKVLSLDEYDITVMVSGALNLDTIFLGGEHLIPCVFEPKEDLIKHYRRIEGIQIPLTVDKRLVSFSFAEDVERVIEFDELNQVYENPYGIAYVYGTMYQHPQTIVKYFRNGSEFIVNDANLEYIYFKDRPQGYVLQPGEEIMEGYYDYVRLAGAGINNSTPVGKYYVLIRTVGGNYLNQDWKSFYVVKAVLKHNISDISIPTIKYGQSLNEANFPYFSVTNADDTKFVYGRFEYFDLEIFPDVATEIKYAVQFVPVTQDYQIYTNFKPLKYDLGVTVQKKNLEISVSNLHHVYTGRNVSAMGLVVDPESETEYLPLVYIYSTIDGKAPKDAGEYSVTISIDPAIDKYTGEIATTMTIEKALVSIDTSDVEKEYAGTPLSFSPKYSFPEGTLEETFELNVEYGGFKIRYYTNQNIIMDNPPKNVGLYSVEVELNTKNYRGGGNINFWIAPSIKGIANLSQVYCPPSDNPNDPKVNPVSLLFNEVTILSKDPYGNDQIYNEPHQNVSYIVLYRLRDGGSQNYQADLNYSNAGIYDIRIEFAENGYNKFMEEFMEERIFLEVKKADLDWSLADLYTADYTSYNIYLEGVLLPGGVQSAYYYYRPYNTEDPEEEEFSLTEIPRESGLYQVKVELQDDNYKGEKFTILKINKAKLTILNPPTTNPIYFNTSKEDIEFKPDTGKVRFDVTGQDMTAYGTWSMQSDTELLIVGGSGYLVDIRFTPFEEIARNFDFKDGQMSIRIQKRDISSFIEIDENSLVSTYSKAERSALAYISENANIVLGYSRIKLDYLYNGVMKNPVEVGDYELVVNVNDENYSGKSLVKMFRIKKAEPIIVFPTIKPVFINDVINNEYIIPQTGNGINPNDSQILVLGTFSFYEESIEMDKANIHYVDMNFHPNESNSYYDINFKIPIYVIGEAPNIVRAEAFFPNSDDNNPKYGTKLKDFTLKIFMAGEDGEVEATTGDGTWAWKNPEDRISVGGEATYIFTPANLDRQNVYEGKVSLNIKEAEMEVDEQGSEVLMFVGSGNVAIENFIQLLQISLKTKNRDFQDMNISPNIEILSNENEGINFSSIVARPEDAGGFLKYEGDNNVWKDLYINFTLRAVNYKETTIRLPIRVFFKVSSEDITVKSKSKKYDGREVSSEDLDIIISGTYREIPASALLIKKSTLNGVEVFAICDPGIYTVELEIDDEQYFGSTTFVYTILKNNITSSLIILNNDRIFLDSSPMAKADFGDELNQVIQLTGTEILYNYYGADGVTSLGVLPPRDAGDYWVEVQIDLENRFFEAFKRFSYKINKKEATITLNSTYTFSYGSPIKILPELSNALSSEDYLLQYFLIGSQEPLISIPSNVGTYRAAYQIVHKNYYGSKEISITISRLRLELNLPPSVDSLEYGVKLESAGFYGGEVVTRDALATRVEGTYSFVTPHATPATGTTSVQVRFSPINSNYEGITFPIDIVITTRKANINFISSSSIYNGRAQLPVIKTDPALGIKVTYQIYRDNLRVSDAIEVGNYRVIATILDDNYEGTNTLESFQILKAKGIMSESKMPNPSSIEYNQALNKSSLLEGYIVYVSGASPVAGYFRYTNGDIMLGPVGEYPDTPFQFVPVDTANYEIFESTVTVNVVKTEASISVQNTIFEYGQQIRKPEFETNPPNLNITNIEFENDMGNLWEVGTYKYTALISDLNYEGKIVYNITVVKKVISLQFYHGTMPVDRYQATYGNSIYAKAKININSLVSYDVQLVDEIENDIQYHYKSMLRDSSQLLMTPPKELGEYRVYAKIDHRNYELVEGQSWVGYKIDKADVQRLEFDHKSLSSQVYGSVTMPTILVTPFNVQVRVSFPGYLDMPTSAGTHSIRIEVIDTNYKPISKNGTFVILPKEISMESLKAFDKPVDGLSEMRVTGSLGGILPGDEVSLKISAHTEGKQKTVGTHNIIIEKWELKGLHASNYKVRTPVYSLYAKITNKVITDEKSSSYITSTTGFSNNITVSFEEVYDTINKTNFLTSLFGQKATVQTISIKENGLNTVLDNKVKFYVKIPEAYLNSDKLVVEGLGALSTQQITFSREGEYMTFYADTPGEIIFYENSFPYWIIILVASILVLAVGFVLIFVLYPKRKRKSIPYGAREAFKWINNAQELEIKGEMQTRIKEKEKKRRWKL